VCVYVYLRVSGRWSCDARFPKQAFFGTELFVVENVYYLLSGRDHQKYLVKVVGRSCTLARCLFLQQLDGRLPGVLRRLDRLDEIPEGFPVVH
jgi:hypothetical protein